MKNSFIKLLFIQLIVLNVLFYAQTSNPSLRRIGFMKGNNIGLSTYNDGAIAGYNIGTDIRGEWPLNSGENYIGDMTPCIGVEVNTSDGVIHSVIISRGPRNGQGQETDPYYGHFRGFNPLISSTNSNSESYPLSSDQSSWPAGWNSVWPGVFNSGEIIADLEGYFTMNDEWDNEFNQNYSPFISDSSINGLGIQVSVRYLQFNTPEFEDVFFRIYDISNNSDYNYDKVFFGNITGSMSGGDGDSGDDLAYLDQDSQIIFYEDSDGIGNKGQQTAVMGEAFLESPSFGEINSFEFFNIVNSPDLSNDSLLWSRFTTPYEPGTPSPPQDGDVLYGTNTFPLASQQTVRIVSAIAFDYEKEMVKSKIQLAEAFWHNRFDYQSLFNSISINNFTSDEYNSIVPIRWSGNTDSGSVHIFYTADFGKSWISIGENLPNNGSYDWDASLFTIEESPFAQIKVVLYDDNYVTGQAFSNYFILNKNGNGAPVLKIVDEDDLYNGILTDDIYALELLVGDPEKEDLSCNIFYKTSKNGEYIFFEHVNYTSSLQRQQYQIDLSKIPNSDNLFIKFALTDSENEFTYETSSIRKKNDRIPLTSNYYDVISGYAESKLDIIVIDRASLLPEEYLVTFDNNSGEGQTFINVNKVSDGSPILTGEEILPNQETSIFNGILVKPDFVRTEFDSSRSHWHSNALNNYTYYMKSFTAYNMDGYPLPNDYKIIFYDNNVANSTADTLFPSTIVPSIPVNFRIFNTTKNKEVNFAAVKSGLITSTLSIWLLEDNIKNVKRTWRIDVLGPDANNYPVGIDTLSLITKKGFSSYDTLKIKNLVTSVNEIQTQPSNFILYQNYPNPFNPSTTIRFALPSAENVNLSVYNVLGEKVAELINGRMQAGNYSVDFNAENFASGIYIYSINAGSYKASYKMILMK